jgi:threonine dehydratase
MGANVLVALQIAREDEQEFIDRAHALGYEFQDECNNEAFQLILR